jgi:hypothetical protein
MVILEFKINFRDAADNIDLMIVLTEFEEFYQMKY